MKKLRRDLVLNRYVVSSFNKHEIIIDDSKYFCSPRALKRLRLRKQSLYILIGLSFLLIRFIGGLSRAYIAPYVLVITLAYYGLSLLIISPDILKEISQISQ